MARLSKKKKSQCKFNPHSALMLLLGSRLAVLTTRLYSNTTVLLPCTTTRSCRCHRTALASTVRSKSRPCVVGRNGQAQQARCSQQSQDKCASHYPCT